MPTQNTIRCERCNEILNPNTLVWLDYDQRYSAYTDGYEIPEKYSQGGFTFGRKCASIERRKYEKLKASTKELKAHETELEKAWTKLLKALTEITDELEGQYDHTNSLDGSTEKARLRVIKNARKAIKAVKKAQGLSL